MEAFPHKKYNILYIDPPWKYNENWGNGAVIHHYDSLPITQIKDFPVQDLADENCHLYIWTTNPFIREALDLCEHWGFSYKQIITWVKTYKSGEPIMGLGYYYRVCTEHCIFGVRGKLPRINKSIKNLITTTINIDNEDAFYALQRKHSEKPPEFRNTIVAHSGDLPRIELFARHTVPGWDCWGLEVGKYD